MPMPVSSPAAVNTVRACDSTATADDWTAFFSENRPLALLKETKHKIEVQADVHSTAFLRWLFRATNKASQIRLRVTYSEGYELEPRSYPFFRSKADRLDAAAGHIVGPYDDVTFDLPEAQGVHYEPFWFRTFRLLQVEITVGSEPVSLLAFEATQVNYPLAVKANWCEPSDAHSERIWEVSIRTMRNCMFDGYSDCPFYEQLQ